MKTRLLRHLALSISFASLACAAPLTFQNPLNPSADPWMGYADGEYHLATTQGDCVRLWSARTIGKLREAKPILIGGQGKGVWAPEFHNLRTKNGSKWFCYFTKTDGDDERHRMFVMQSKTASIKGPYEPPHQLETDPKNEFYAIDGTVFENRGTLYFVWAGHPGHVIFISKMKDPKTLEGERVNIPASGFGCSEVREGPYILQHENRIFLTYSACDTGKPDYKVGYLWMDNSKDPMNPKSWTQQEKPLLERSDENKAWGPGHHSFFKSPDGKEDWIAYHAKTTPEYTYRGRSTRAQVLKWDEAGFPEKVVPLPLDAKIPLPSGDRG